MSKILDRVFVKQLTDQKPFLWVSITVQNFQYRNSIVTVTNDVFASGSGVNCVLVLLEFSAAFDTIYHSILHSYNELEHALGMKPTVLQRFVNSYRLAFFIGSLLNPELNLNSFSYAQSWIIKPDLILKTSQ